MKIYHPVVFVLFILLAASIVGLLVSWPPREGELANVGEWSELQVADLAVSRREPDTNVYVFRVDDRSKYWFLYIRHEKNSKNHSIYMLNAENIPRIKMFPMPPKKFKISRQEFNYIIKNSPLNSEMEILLSISISD